MKNYGCCRDNSLSEHLKCIVKQGEISVTGKLPNGYTSLLTHKWVSPFQENSPGSVFPKTGDLIQAVSGRTMKGYMNSLLTWANSEHQSLSLPLSFSASSNPEEEVDAAVMALQIMSSPSFCRGKLNTAENSVLEDVFSFIKNRLSAPLDIGGRIPRGIQVSIGRKFILRNCIIDSVEVNDPMLKTSNGLSLKMSVTLNIRTRYTQDRVDIGRSYRIQHG